MHRNIFYKTKGPYFKKIIKLKKKSANDNYIPNTKVGGRFFIQIIYSISSLSTYCENVKEKIWGFPSFRECCPICHGQNCAVRIGFYYRRVTDIFSKESFTIPIARFKCNQLNTPRIKDRTFSLLPDSLIPYYSITIDTLMFIVMLKFTQSKTNIDILDILYEKFYSISFNITEISLERYYHLFHQACLKLKWFFTNHKNHSPPDFHHRSNFQIARFINTFSYSSEDESYSGPIGLSDFNYIREGGYVKNARFLFGTPYQHLSI